MGWCLPAILILKLPTAGHVSCPLWRFFQHVIRVLETEILVEFTVHQHGNLSCFLRSFPVPDPVRVSRKALPSRSPEERWSIVCLCRLGGAFLQLTHPSALFRACSWREEGPVARGTRPWDVPAGRRPARASLRSVRRAGSAPRRSPPPESVGFGPSPSALGFCAPRLRRWWP